MSRITRFAAVLALIVLAVAAHAGVTVRGTIRVWNPQKGSYQPLQEARVRLVLAEYWDTDTLDVESTTDAAGNYSIGKCNPWWRDGYDAYLIVFAEVPNKLEVQTHWGQIDGYQAVSSGFTAAKNHTTTCDLTIGGSSDNARRYQVGGVAALDNSDSTSAQRGARAFFLCREMTDHRRKLVAGALGEGNFEEKEVSYPVSQDTADYRCVLDYIRFPDFYFDIGDLWRCSDTARHELSHGIMADEYWTWPGWTYGSFGSHSLDTVAEHREWAWSEAWAEFMAAVTHNQQYGQVAFDFETQNPSWHTGIPASADHSRIEGEIAASMWDIHDGTGWEKRYEQDPNTPGDDMFYDGITDGELAKIWGIVSSDHPHSFTHETYMDSADNFVHYWLGRGSYGARHELKAILYNRGITVPQLSQHRPTVAVGAITWTGNVARIPVTVTEQDADDRPKVRLELFVNGLNTYSQWLSSGWSGATCATTVEQPVAWRAGTPKPQLIVAVHDDMQSSTVSRTLDPPATATTTGLVAEVLAVSVRRSADLPWVDLSANEALRDVVVTCRVFDAHTTTPTRFPTTGSWTIPELGEVRDTNVREAYRGTSVPPYLDVAFTVTGRDAGRDFSETWTKRYTPADNYGLGVHTETVLRRQWTKDLMMWMDTDIETRVQVVYRLTALHPSVALLRPMVALANVLEPVAQFKRPTQRLVLAPLATATAGPVLIRTMPLTGKETPTVLLSRSSQLADETARLQAQALEAAEELQAHLGPTPPVGAAGAPAAMGAPVTKRPPTQAPLLQQNLQAPAGVLLLPPTAFLDSAAAGRGQLKRLNPAERQLVTHLQQDTTAREKRLAELQTLSAQLAGALAAAQVKMNRDATTTPQVKAEVNGKLQEAATRVSAVRQVLTPTQTLLSKQQQVIGRGLTMK